jgi:hypothetical protein
VLEDPYRDAVAVGAHRRGERVGRRQWWGVAVLAVGISATAIVVPPLVTSWSGNALKLGHDAPSTSGSASQAPSVVTPSAGTPPSGTPQPEFSPIRIAAGAPGNEMSGRAAVVACGTCPSGSRVQYLGQGASVVVHVRGVAVPGGRTLTITYESVGPPRTLNISVNGVYLTSLVLSGKDDWLTPAYATTPITLPVGNSTIRFFNETDPAPDLDEILIS